MALDDGLVALNTIMGNRFCGPISAEVTSWQKKLVLLQETLDEWLACQKQWMYLENIFCAQDIQRQLPTESKKFFVVDKSFKELMMKAYEDPNCIKRACAPGLKEMMTHHNESLDKIQKSLEDYLETKRQAFPRFYFLSNEELLEILAQTRDPHAVQPHLRKAFDCIQSLTFGAGASVDIMAMHSPEGERVNFTQKNLKARGNVEAWLMDVQKAMQGTLLHCMKECVMDYDARPRPDWIMAGVHPGQCIAAVAQIMWCRGTEQALLSPDPVAATTQWHSDNVDQIADLTKLVRGDLTKIQRKIIVALVTVDVHARDIIQELIDDKVDRLGNFKWMQQLRYYWQMVESGGQTKEDCIIRQTNSLSNYAYEYMGCTSRLVITPLTDRCWMTITGAIHIKLGAAPAGPAGTGKTESSKDLAKAMGTFCVVFNCSDQINYQMLGKLFAGLAQCGCWTCLDEFNRIEIEVLSVVAQQLLVLRNGMLAEKDEIDFMGRNISLLTHCVIITMNPGYAGRTELPDNLKVCFRPVCMMVPDYALIAEIMLYAGGFKDTKVLAKRMVKMYKLCSEQLSQQRHYDYGMRAVISVLIKSGSLRRENPHLSEDVVIIKAMRDSNTPKFLAPDLPLFVSILRDLFPGVVVPFDDFGVLLDAIEAEIREGGMQPVPAFITKVIQLFEVFEVRFGVCVVGPTTGGKSTAETILMKACTRLRKEGIDDERMQLTIRNILNPKAIRMGELYGEFNPMTQEWTDGLASTIMRADAREGAAGAPERRWTVFDGPIDAIWIENMNTVLDDNQMLCLANSERIRLHSNQRMLFEVQDLEVASPATVSRLGIVWQDQEVVGWEAYIVSWLAREMGTKRMPQESNTYLSGLVMAHFDPMMDWQRRNCKEPIGTCPIQLATSMSSLFTSLFIKAAVDPNQDVATINKLTNKLFAFSLAWSVGGSIHGEYMDAFAEKIGDQLSDICNTGAASIFEVFVDESGEFKKWETVVPTFAYDSTVPYFNMVVPTVDTVRYAELFLTDFNVMQSVFFTGQTGTGKTVVIQDLLTHMSKPVEEGGRNILPIVLNFSGQTKAIDTQLAIERKLEKKRKNLLGGPAGKKVVLFVDDINMPIVEEYGAQPPNELLRQFQDYKGFWDREKLFFKDICDTMMAGAAAPPGGGRSEVTPRLMRHFHMLCLPPATDSVLKLIFTSILNGFLATKFSDDVKSLGDKVVLQTIEMYKMISTDLRPTPAKFHYVFNLRDVSKVFQGCLMIRPKQCGTKEIFGRLWLHECLRVFHDRLINDDDRAYYTNLTIGCVNKVGFSMDHETVFEKGEPLMFCDFLRPAIESETEGGQPTTIYEMVTKVDRVEKLLYDSMDDYNLSNPTQMKLVFFLDAIKHITRIKRILGQPRGNAMLVGVGGSGKQSLTRMAAHIGETRCFQIEIVRGYGPDMFHEDIKGVMIEAGVTGAPIAFLFIDTQIVHKSFLEDINNILNTGDVPGLFPADEMNKICEDLRPFVKHLGLETRDELQAEFVRRVRDNMHMILCMSPVGDSLRIQCREFPALINCTTIDWFSAWPLEALLSVSEMFLEEVQVGTETAEAALKDMRSRVARMCAEIHWSSAQLGEDFFAKLRRRVYTTPKSYLDLINLFISMLDEKRSEVQVVRDKMTVGVSKLVETKSVVAGLEEDIKKLEPVLVVKGAEAAVLIETVKVEKADAEKTKTLVEADEAVVGKQAAETKAIADDAQKDLDEALPALEKALKALDALKKDDITEIRNFSTPPPLVQTVLEAVCVLLGEKTDWKSAKTVMQDKFMERLKAFDKDNISEGTLKKLRKYTVQEDFTVEKVARVSSAAKSLCMWCHAMDLYSRVAKTVEPKKKLVAEMNAQLASAMAVLKEKQDTLATVIAKVDGLEETLRATLEEKQALEDESELCKARLVTAEKLTIGLADEEVAWKEAVVTLNLALENVTGDALLSAASVSYYGPFTGVYREQIVKTWVEKCGELGLATSDNPALSAIMGDPVLIRQWQIDELPTDTVSTNNGILVTRGKRWPLMIDPQEQAKKWIKNTESKNNLHISRLTDPNMLRTLESCIRMGAPLLIEDIGEALDPGLEPVLQRATFNQGGRLLIRLGDQDVDYDVNFKFYVTTKFTNPHYLPEVCIKVTVINFTVTMDGLEDQLLGDVVLQERPDVSERKNKLVLSMSADAKQLKKVQDEILRMLSESEGNILDDHALVETLDKSKVVSNAIKERLKESAETEREIDETRAGYKPAALRGSILYFVIADLGLVDPMYQYSLQYFKSLYNKCIMNSEKSDHLDTRLSNIMKFLSHFVYGNICRGLFERHKLTYSFLITVQILRNQGDIPDGEWSFLLRGAGMVVNPAANPSPKTVPEMGWNLLHALETGLPETFGGITQDILDNWDLGWSKWAESETPEEGALPGLWTVQPNGSITAEALKALEGMENDEDGGVARKLALRAALKGEFKLTMFQRMLLLKCFREEKVVYAVSAFVEAQLGREYVETPPVQMADVYADTDYKTPVVFILSTGADPTGMLFTLAKKMNYMERVHICSLGQGQGPLAKSLVKKGCQTGDWVLLQNCHLMKSWMQSLEQMVQTLSEGNDPIHPDFRLFLTSMPAAYFPVPVLQNGVKVTNEPPKGIRANLIRSLGQLNDWEPWDECTGDIGLTTWKRLAFSVCFYHAIIQERRKFGPLGWNILYGFNDSDLETCVMVLKMFLQEQPQVPYDALTYLTGQIAYGGRVTDDQDRRCSMSILKQFYTEGVLDAGYKFSASGTYYIPEIGDGTIDHFLNYVKQLPMNDSPEVFGMHDNANIAFEMSESQGMLTTALSIQPRETSSGDGGKTPDEKVDELATHILDHLPGILDREQAGETTFVMRGENLDSLATVLGQEMIRFNKLLRVMRSTLVDIRKAIKGEVLMSDTLDKMYTCFINNQVPEVWEKAAYPSLKPLASWINDLHARVEFMQKWLLEGPPNAFVMSYFFFPQGFMTGTLQNHARKYLLPIDTLNFRFEVQVEEDALDKAEPPEDGVYVGGMFMDGARWARDAQTIEDAFPGELFNNMSVVHFIPAELHMASPAEYSCPVYKTSTRAGELSTTGMSTNFVLPVELPCPPGKDSDYWVRKGVAFLLNLND